MTITIPIVAAVAILALIPAEIASRKGHDFRLWYLGGLILFPIALLEAILTPAAGHERQRRALVTTWTPFLILSGVLVTVIGALIVWATLR